jgi:hypothetical protein
MFFAHIDAFTGFDVVVGHNEKRFPALEWGISEIRKV